MMWLSLIFLVLLGLLGISSWLKSRQPTAAGPMDQLESIAGWAGLAGVVWGLFLLVRAISWIGVMLRYAFGGWLLLVLTALVILALSLILAAPILRQLIGGNGFTDGVDKLAAKLAPFRVPLGFACLGLALWSLLNYAF